MMAKLRLCLTVEDIASAERYKISNPVHHKLQNTTGTLWRLCNDGLAMETMSPFRATLLPLWAMNGWHENSANRRGLPREFDLEMCRLQPDGAAISFDSRSSNYSSDGSVCDNNLSRDMLSDEAVQTALLQVLANNGWSSWRTVCSHIFVEQIEPYRTIVLKRDELNAAKTWLHSLNKPALSYRDGDGSTPATEAPLRLSAELHSPLTLQEVQPITINFPSRWF